MTVHAIAVAGLRSLGLRVDEVDFDNPEAFVAGTWLDDARLVVGKAACVSDVLHEAGHLAITPSPFRHLLTPKSAYNAQLIAAMAQYSETHFFIDENGAEDPVLRDALQAGECEATAWSYAAACAFGIDTCLLFAARPDGTIPFLSREAADQVYNGLKRKAYFGINGLQAAGYCTVNEFPKMKRWLAR